MSHASRPKNVFEALARSLAQAPSLQASLWSPEISGLHSPRCSVRADGRTAPLSMPIVGASVCARARCKRPCAPPATSMTRRAENWVGTHSYSPHAIEVRQPSSTPLSGSKRVFSNT